MQIFLISSWVLRSHDKNEKYVKGTITKFFKSKTVKGLQICRILHIFYSLIQTVKTNLGPTMV